MSSPLSIFSTFPKMEIFRMDKTFHYVNGGVGPYYIDLRRVPNDVAILKNIVSLYDNLVGQRPCFVGVPTTGVVFATCLSILNKAPLVVFEKLNPQRYHVFSPLSIYEVLEPLIDLPHTNVAYLGLEDMGVVLATACGVTFNRPSAILRRVPKGHGTSKTIEASLSALSEQGINVLRVINDPFMPLTKDEILETVQSVPGSEKFLIEVISTLKLSYRSSTPFNPSEYNFYEIEDIWTTGTSSIQLYDQIKKAFPSSNPRVVVFLDREQHAMRKFSALGIDARTVCTISKVADHLHREHLVSTEAYTSLLSYLKTFDRPSFMSKLTDINTTQVCVGIDITANKFPKKRTDTVLRGYPYPAKDESLASATRRYCMDLMDEIIKVPSVRVIKPNLAYYNSLSDNDLHSILVAILEKAHLYGILVILDAKIGDIMRTQSQYAEKYKRFDAVTANGYMGSDSIFPITDSMLGCFVLVLTSNPSRTDLETRTVMDEEGKELMTDLVDGGLNPLDAFDYVVQTRPKVYQVMAQKVIDWQFAGSVGAVIGGTPSKDGKLDELEEIVHMFGTQLGYLPPILIPGVGAQGGSASTVISAIEKVLLSLDWSTEKIEKEIRKVLINSSSAIDYAPDPAQAIRDLVDEVSKGITL